MSHSKKHDADDGIENLSLSRVDLMCDARCPHNADGGGGLSNYERVPSEVANVQVFQRDAC